MNMEYSGQIEDGNDLHDDSFEKSFRKLEKKAHAGSRKHQFELGFEYNHGQQFVCQDWVKEAYWYKKSADQGYTLAQFHLGLHYFNGMGVGRDVDKALYWYKKAAKKNHGAACWKLGTIYREGEEVPQDLKAAFNYFVRSAKKDSPNAHYEVGRMYENGEYVDRDYSLAFDSYKKAADLDAFYTDAKKGMMRIFFDKKLYNKFDGKFPKYFEDMMFLDSFHMNNTYISYRAAKMYLTPEYRDTAKAIEYLMYTVDNVDYWNDDPEEILGECCLWLSCMVDKDDWDHDYDSDGLKQMAELYADRAEAVCNLLGKTENKE